jgi:hypothetical protein
MQGTGAPAQPSEQLQQVSSGEREGRGGHGIGSLPSELQQVNKPPALHGDVTRGSSLTLDGHFLQGMKELNLKDKDDEAGSSKTGEVSQRSFRAR